MISRRKFLSRGCALGIATTSASSTLLQLGLARSAAAQSADDYRALVCILLAGGNDSYNMVVPDDDDQYLAYSELRSDLALPQSSLLPLNASTAAGRRYGLHPGMPELQSLFNQGDAAILCNVGTLLGPLQQGVAPLENPALPLGLFSHSDQIAQWQTAISGTRVAEGWGGRAADLLQSQNMANGVSMNISLSGNNTFQSGSTVGEYSISPEGNGAPGIIGYGEASEFGDYRTAIVDALLDRNYDALLREEYRLRLRGAIDAQEVFSSAIQTAPELSTQFSPGYFSAALRQIARVISVRDALGARRQTFFITVGGWDHHDDVLENQAAMLPDISRGLSEFQQALAELNVLPQVTTFTTSDFGRTLTSNGKGSDHGWGGHHIVMGGAVNGGEFYGEYPELMPSSPLDVGRGVYAPTTSLEQYFGELAMWLGVSPSELPTVLPNVESFYNPAAGGPLGFMG